MKKVKNPQTLGDNINNKMVDTYLSEKEQQSEVTVNESRHTPGQWSIIKDHPVFRYSDIIMSGKIMICDMVKIHGDSFEMIEDEEVEANARLIAAAPDMLEALKEAEKVILTLKQNHHFYEDDLGLPIVQAAITKATNSK